jgi:hypothetical protein
LIQLVYVSFNLNLKIVYICFACVKKFRILPYRFTALLIYPLLYFFTSPPPHVQTPALFHGGAQLLSSLCLPRSDLALARLLSSSSESCLGHVELLPWSPSPSPTPSCCASCSIPSSRSLPAPDFFMAAAVPSHLPGGRPRPCPSHSSPFGPAAASTQPLPWHTVLAQPLSAGG